MSFATSRTLNPLSWGGADNDYVFDTQYNQKDRSFAGVATLAAAGAPFTLEISHEERTKAGLVYPGHLVRANRTIALDEVPHQITASLVVKYPEHTSVTATLLREIVGVTLQQAADTGNLEKLMNREV